MTKRLGIWALAGLACCWLGSPAAVWLASELALRLVAARSGTHPDSLEGLSHPLTFWLGSQILILVLLMLAVQGAWILLARRFRWLEDDWRSVCGGLFLLTTAIAVAVYFALWGFTMGGKAAFFALASVGATLGVATGLSLARLLVPTLRPGAFARDRGTWPARATRDGGNGR